MFPRAFQLAKAVDETFGWILSKAQAIGLSIDSTVLTQFNSFSALVALDKLNET
jgi:hypothetical protein